MSCKSAWIKKKKILNLVSSLFFLCESLVLFLKKKNNFKSTFTIYFSFIAAAPTLSRKERLRQYEENIFYDPNTEMFQCGKCFKVFKRKDVIQNHYESFHSDILAYNCKFCGHAFKSINSLRAHIFRLHREAGQNPSNMNIYW